MTPSERERHVINQATEILADLFPAREECSLVLDAEESARVMRALDRNDPFGKRRPLKANKGMCPSTSPGSPPP